MEASSVAAGSGGTSSIFLSIKEAAEANDAVTLCGHLRWLNTLTRDEKIPIMGELGSVYKDTSSHATERDAVARTLLIYAIRLEQQQDPVLWSSIGDEHVHRIGRAGVRVTSTDIENSGLWPRDEKYNPGNSPTLAQYVEMVSPGRNSTLAQMTSPCALPSPLSPIISPGSAVRGGSSFHTPPSSPPPSPVRGAV